MSSLDSYITATKKLNICGMWQVMHDAVLMASITVWNHARKYELANQSQLGRWQWCYMNAGYWALPGTSLRHVRVHQKQDDKHCDKHCIKTQTLSYVHTMTTPLYTYVALWLSLLLDIPTQQFGTASLCVYVHYTGQFTYTGRYRLQNQSPPVSLLRRQVATNAPRYRMYG